MPLKSSVRGKSRIEVDPAVRRELALAMAADTVTAAAAADGVRAVLIVVDDPEDAQFLLQIPRVRMVRTYAAELNRAIRDGLEAVPGDLGASESRDRDGIPTPVAVLPGDLPSLLPTELSTALRAVAGHRRAVVADRQGTGTTLLTASAVPWLHPNYGAGSFGRHLADGAVHLDLPEGSGLRRDVDQIADLADVTGPRTVKVLEKAGLSRTLCVAAACSPARPAL